MTTGQRSSDTYSWSGRTLDELEQAYWDKVAPRLRDLDIDPHEPPRYQDLVDGGVSGFARPFTKGAHSSEWTLQQFLTEYVGLDTESDHDTPWGIADEQTVARLEEHLQHHRDRLDHPETTIRTMRSRLGRWARLYADLHGQANIVERASDPANETSEFDRQLAVFDRLDEELATDETKLGYLSTVNGFYSRLLRRSVVAFNPVADFSREYAWERPQERDKPSLDPSDIQALWTTASDASERLLVVATAGWGLRRREVAELHVSQFVLNDGTPRLVFDDDRKSGPGTVALIYGVDILEDRIAQLTDRHEWSGYLFPSPEQHGPVAPDTVTDRFSRLAARADVDIVRDGDRVVGKPHMARRYWYQAYQDAVSTAMDRLQDVAEDQGASSVDVVWSNYLDEEQRREHRRSAMRDQLAAAFEDATQNAEVDE